MLWALSGRSWTISTCGRPERIRPRRSTPLKSSYADQCSLPFPDHLFHAVKTFRCKLKIGAAVVLEIGNSFNELALHQNSLPSESSRRRHARRKTAARHA